MTLKHKALPWILGLLAMLVCAPSLDYGWLLDDDFHRAALTRPDLPQVSRTPSELFNFLDGDENKNQFSITMGFLPWWSNKNLKLSFYRPITGYTHWLDYQFWPESPWMMHLHSLLWLGAVVVAGSFFFFRLFKNRWAGVLAALCFAVDDAHGVPAFWIANRNVLISCFFGMLALITYDKWRKDGWRMGAFLAPLFLSAALLSKESALAICAYLFAYAIFLDKKGLRALIPCAVVSVVWLVFYKKLGYGASGSSWYFDPSSDPLGFLLAIFDRAPNLLAWQWLVPGDLEWDLSPRGASLLWWGTMGLLVLIGFLLIPLLKTNPLSRFFALGMLLSLLPICASYPSPRLLMFASIGGMGLLGLLMADLWRNPKKRVICISLVILHLIIGPFILFQPSKSFERFKDAIIKTKNDLKLGDRANRVKTTLIVNAPTFTTISYSALSHVLEKDKLEISRGLVLGSGGGALKITRMDDRSLLFRWKDGPFLQESPSEMQQVLFNLSASGFSMDRLYRDKAPFVKGEQIKVFGMTVIVTKVNDQGQLEEAAFRFLTKLENPFFRWVQWKDGAFVPFTLPKVGEDVTLNGFNRF